MSLTTENTEKSREKQSGEQQAVSYTGRLFGMSILKAGAEIVNELTGTDYGVALKIIQSAEEQLMNRMMQEPVRFAPEKSPIHRMD